VAAEVGGEVNNVDEALHFECYLKYVGESLLPLVCGILRDSIVIQSILSSVKEFVV
jgi:hypothetical protein